MGGSGEGGGSNPSRSATEAKSALDELSPVKDVWKDARQNPFSVSSEEINEGDVVRAFETAKIETVDLTSLKTNQETIRGNRVNAMIDLYAEGKKPEAGIMPSNFPASVRQEGYDKSLPTVLKTKSGLVIWDGNHRLSAQKLLGVDKTKAIVVDIGSET